MFVGSKPIEKTTPAKSIERGSLRGRSRPQVHLLDLWDGLPDGQVVGADCAPGDALCAACFCRAELQKTGRGDAAAATWIFRGDRSWRRRGRDVDIPWRRTSHRRYALARNGREALNAACGSRDDDAGPLDLLQVGAHVGDGPGDPVYAWLRHAAGPWVRAVLVEPMRGSFEREAPGVSREGGSLGGRWFPWRAGRSAEGVFCG